MRKSIIFYYIKLFTSNTPNAFQFLLLFYLTIPSSVGRTVGTGHICYLWFLLVITRALVLSGNDHSENSILCRPWYLALAAQAVVSVTEILFQFISQVNCLYAFQSISKPFTAIPDICFSTKDLEIRFVSQMKESQRGFLKEKAFYKTMSAV